jgi:molecular chaperone GrpE (heat shock protein)
VTTTGYEAAKRAGDDLARSVQEIATLVGQPQNEPVTLASGATLIPGLGMADDAAALEARARDLEQGLFTLIVLGEFKNGKSTLLNAMLGSKTLPAKAAPATAIITVLVKGERKTVAVWETGKNEPRRLAWEDFVREFQLNPQDQETIQEKGTLDRFANIEFAEIETKHALCARGVKLIDSPGLGEHVSRTRVATSFLKRSQAVIMVLNATRILTRDERSFIDTTLGEGRLAHVFFVVNRINQVDDDSAVDIRQWLESELEPHFLNEQGEFDRDLYQRRVFYVNARGALDARSTVPNNDDAVLASSGVPELEQELEHFLTSGERVAAALQSTAQFINPVIDQATVRIQQAQAALDAPVRELEERRADAEHRLEKLEGRKRETERTILLFSDTIKQKVFADLNGFVEGLADTWDEDSRRLMDLDRAVSLRNVLASYAQQEARDRMAAAISEEVQMYVQAKFNSWSDRIPSVIEPDIRALVAEVEAQIDDLQLELERIAAAFAGSSQRTRERSDSSRLFRLALSFGEIKDMTDDVFGVGDMSNMIGRMVQKSVVVLLVRSLLGASLLVSTLLVQVSMMGLHESDVKRRIRQTLGERLIAALREQVKEKQGFIYGAIDERFGEFAAGTTRVIGQQIDDVRNEQERLLSQKRDESFSVDREKRRLTAVATELAALQVQLKFGSF